MVRGHTAGPYHLDSVDPKLAIEVGRRLREFFVGHVKRVNDQWLSAGSALLIVLAVIKMCWVVLFTPIIGYGNNYDFLKQSACTGLWQNVPGQEKITPSPKRPVRSLVFDGDRNVQQCLHSTDNMFSHLVAQFHQVGGAADLREVGLCKIVVVVMSIVLLMLQIRLAWLRLSVAAVFFLVFTDLSHLTYFNTLYFEVAGILGCFLAIAVAVWFWTAPSRPTAFDASIGACLLVLLGFAKQQYNPLAAAVGLLYAMIFFYRWRQVRLAVSFIVLAAMLPLSYGVLNSSKDGPLAGISYANLTDTFFGAVLPETADKGAALRTLGLPDSCAPAIGSNWFSPGFSDHHPCPEIRHISRVRLLGLFLQQPATFVRPMQKAILAARPLYPDVLGDVETPEVVQTLRYRFSRWSSLSSWLAGLPEALYLAVVSLSMVAGILVVVPCMRGPSGRHYGVADAAMMMVGLGGLINLYAVSSSVFGDGYADMSRHALSLTIGVAFQVGGGLAAICTQFLLWQRRSQGGPVARNHPTPLRSS